jgi:hypothetical protein
MIGSPPADNHGVRVLPQAETRQALAWLENQGADGVTGYEATGWEDHTWLLHAMYQTDELPSGMTYDEAARIERTALPAMEPGDQLSAVLRAMDEGSTLIGGALGASWCPGPGWRRLLWTELAARLGRTLFNDDVPPCYRSFPFTSWPVNICPPAEGSIDREQFSRLIGHLVDHSRDGRQTTCFAFRCGVATFEFEESWVATSSISELTDLYDDVLGAPNNVWPSDRSWFMWGDADLWATKVSGGRQLIDAIRNDVELESFSGTWSWREESQSGSGA